MFLFQDMNQTSYCQINSLSLEQVLKSFCYLEDALDTFEWTICHELSHMYFVHSVIMYFVHGMISSLIRLSDVI